MVGFYLKWWILTKIRQEKEEKGAASPSRCRAMDPQTTCGRQWYWWFGIQERVSPPSDDENIKKVRKIGENVPFCLSLKIFKM